MTNLPPKGPTLQVLSQKKEISTYEWQRGWGGVPTEGHKLSVCNTSLDRLKGSL